MNTHTHSLPRPLTRSRAGGLLVAACATLLVAGPALAGPPPFTTTTLVGCSGNALVDGATLLTALSSATAPGLLLLEPCLYNLGGQQLIMKTGVDIAGSGRDVTTVFSDTSASLTPSTVVAPAGIEAELRQLTVQNGGNDGGTGITIAADDFLLTQVNVEVKSGGDGFGVQTQSASPRLNEIFVRLQAERNAYGVRILGGGTVVTESFARVETAGGSAFAWDVTDGADAVLERVVALVDSGSQRVAVSVSNQARAELINVRGTAFGGARARGLYVFREGFVDVKESTFTAASDTFAAAFQINNARGEATESTFVARPIALDHLGVYAVRLQRSASLDSNQSNYDGSAFAAQNLGTGTARFGASQLIGSVLTSSAAGLQCINAYNGTYTARTATCN